MTNDYNLTYKFKHTSKRDYVVYYLNGIKIFEHKMPFDVCIRYNLHRSYDLEDKYILNNTLYRIKNDNVRKSPLSRNILAQFNIPKDLKIIAIKYKEI